jgi:hypothetical protein
LFRVLIVSLIIVAGVAGGVAGGLLSNDVLAIVALAALIAFGVYVSLLFLTLYALSFLYGKMERTTND